MLRCLKGYENIHELTKTLEFQRYWVNHFSNGKGSEILRF
jgi:hypothetical protein